MDMLNSYIAMGKISENLAKIMAKHGISQIDLAKKSLVAQPLISSYLNESKRAQNPSVRNLLKIRNGLRLLGVPVTLEDLTGLETLHGAEAKLPELTPEDLRFGKFYKSLLDGDPLKEYLRKMMEQQSDTGEEGPTEPK